MNINNFVKNFEIENIEGSSIVIARQIIILPEAKKELILSSIAVPENKGIIIPDNNIIGGIYNERIHSSQRGF